MNFNNKEDLDGIKNENINSKSQINNKNMNINITQTNHNKKYIQYIKPLLFLLQKAEQIINIINLPSSSIDKYNQLKEISFKKCGLEFTPLVKNENFLNNIKKENINKNNIQENNKENEILSMELKLSELKSRLIESLLTIIETSNYSNSLNQKENKENNPALINFNTFSNTCGIIREELSKNFESNNDSKIISEKEKLLNYISRSEQNIFSILFENTKKLKELKESYLILNSKIENLFKYINNIDELISPIWNKYYTKEIEWFDENKISDNYELRTYTKCHFLLNFMNQLFLDNKNIMEALSQMEQKKNEAYEILQLPYVKRAIEKGEYLKNVQNLLNKIKKEKEKNNNIDMNKLIQEGKELINCIKETISEESGNKIEGKNNNDKNNNINNNIINTEEIDNYNDDMNIFLGKLMNGIQNILNQVDISIKKDELMENMMKVNNISKNKNLDISNINNINTNNLNSTNMNIISTINNGNMSKDISFISTINNENNKTLNFPSHIYQKKTNHISGSSIKKNHAYENSDKKNNINSIQKFDIKKKVFQKQRIEKNKENLDNQNLVNDKVLIKSINNIIDDKEQDNNIKNKNINNIKIINDDMNEEKAITVGDIGNNSSDAESTQKNKSLKDSLNMPLKENNNQKEKNEEKGLENLKNIVLEDFKVRINKEKEADE